jgi:hypothetical protein
MFADLTHAERDVAHRQVEKRTAKTPPACEPGPAVRCSSCLMVAGTAVRAAGLENLSVSLVETDGFPR